MMKFKAALFSATVAALVGLATAQSSKTQSSKTSASSSKLGSHSATSSTKPLTPKSAMPPARKKAVSAPMASTENRRTNAELSRLEKQNAKVGAPKSGNPNTAKVPPLKSDAKPSTNGSGINSSYQKPKVPKG
jgi:hypothetical protein